MLKSLKKRYFFYKRKVERKYRKSTTNKTYYFPKLPNIDLDDSETSITSLQGVEYYNLHRQNEKVILSDTEQLVELIHELGKISKEKLLEKLK